MIINISITWGQRKLILLQENAPFTLETALMSSTESEKLENASISLKSLQEQRRIKKQIRVAKAISIPLIAVGYACIGSGFVTNLAGYIVDEPVVGITAVSTMGGGVVLVIPGHIFLRRKRRLEKELRKM